MNPLNQLLVFVLVVVVALACYIYFHYIKSEPALDPSDKNWKQYRDEVLNPHLAEDKAWAERVADEGKIRAEVRDEELKLYFKKIWNDGCNVWRLVLEAFKNFGKIINWKQYRVVYCIILAILIGMFLYYVLGV